MLERIIFVGIFVFTLNTFAGHETGHGGGGILCTDAETGYESLEIADLWNGESHGLRIVRTNSISVDEQINAALNKIAKLSWQSKSTVDEVRHNIKEALKVVKFVDMENFPVPVDSGITSLGPDCKLVGIVSFHDAFWHFKKDKILVNSNYYSRLSNTDIAALWVHEAFFKLVREALRIHDSLYAQRAVAFAFSSDEFDLKRWPLDNDRD